MKIKYSILSLFFIVFLIACGGSGGENKSELTDSEKRGNAIYIKYCTLCHGVDGKLGLNGSKDINVSTLTFQERVVLVTNGKNTMTPFRGVISDAEIADVVAYTMTMKEK